MSYGLVGPYPFDPKTVVASTRAALADVARTLRSGRGEDLLEGMTAATSDGLRAERHGTVVEPGIYLLMSHDGSAASLAIAGFWVIPDGGYLNHGPNGPPERVPPFAQSLLDAATEEVWWQNLKVKLSADKSWRPLVVIEWLPHFAHRSALAPPGIPQSEPEAVDGLDGDDRETWLEVPAARTQPAWSEVPSGTWDKRPDVYSHLPRDRSLLVIVRGTLKHDGKLHRGSFFMIPPALLDDDGSHQPVPLDTWVERSLGLTAVDVEAVDHPEDERHHLGRPLLLPDGRLGFQGSGWLTRSLGVWPARPADVAIGALTDRVVQQKWVAQLRLALVSSLFVLGTVLVFSGVVQVLTRPVPKAMKPPPAPAPQPALSVCSADYQEFVDEFRCQIAHLARGGDSEVLEPACRDHGQSTRPEQPQGDLQAEYCALHDRVRDGWQADLQKGDRANFAHFAASQACFNVLGHPYPYKLRELDVAGGDGRVIGNPKSFIIDEALRIEPLRELVDQLDGLCDAYRERAEGTVEGAVFATHIGAPLGDRPKEDGDAASLRRATLAIALIGRTSDTSVCFQRGMNNSLSAAAYQQMCADAPDKLDESAEKIKMWTSLRARTDDAMGGPIISRYANVRFASPTTRVDELWTCHLALEKPEPVVLGTPVGAWEVPVPVPDNYRVEGLGVKTQLELDSALRGMEAGMLIDPGPCWKVVRKQLSNYAPVHPLLAELAEDGWPSEEQQLCGQICASYFSLRRGVNDSSWVTRDQDLAMCLHKTDAGPMYDDGANTLDRLRLPWNDVTRGVWVEPQAAEVCAFNLIAQNLMPPLEEGYVIQQRAPKEYAGETVAGSRIAGGDQGLAARYVQGLAFGRLEAVTSAAACGHVATQCFSGLMLEVAGNPEVERYRWKDQWAKRVEELKQMKRPDLASEYPWCVGIRDYLVPERESAQFDTPCVAGVEEARENAMVAFAMLESAPLPGAGGE